MPNDLVFCTRGEAAPRQTPTGFHIGSPEQAARSDAPLRVKGRYKIKSRIGADFAAKHAKSVTMQENPILSVETIAALSRFLHALRQKTRQCWNASFACCPRAPLTSFALPWAIISCPVGAADCAGLRPAQNIRAEGAKVISPERSERSARNSGSADKIEISALLWAGQICAAPADIGVAIMPRIPVSRPRPPAGN
jgi:hypothetical protein